jgi:hypothetical protein
MSDSNSDHHPKRRVRRPRGERDRDYNKLGPKGAPREGDTPLFVRCPQCEALPASPTRAGWEGCLCSRGYIFTGFTQERFDALIKDNERMLLLLADVREAPADEIMAVDRFLSGREDDIELARNHAKRVSES